VRQVDAARIIARTDLRRRFRNRSFVIRAFVGPLLLAGIISLAFGGGDDVDAKIGLVDADGSPLASGFVGALTGGAADSGGLRFVAVDSAAAARRQVDDGDLGAAIVVPAGFAASLAGDAPADVDVLTSGDSPIAAEVARAVATELTSRAGAGRLAVATASATGAPAPGVDDLAAIDLPVTVETTGTGGHVSPAAYFGPAMGMLFLFLSVGVVAADLLADRRTGLLDRVRSGPVGSGAIIAGRGLAVVAVGVTSLCIIWAFTTAVLGAEWGDPVGVVVVILAAALAVAGIAGLVASLARTEQSAQTVAAAIAFLLALVGGAFVPVGQLPAVLGTVALLTPMGQALRSFALLSAGDAGLVDILPYLAGLLVWAGACGVVATRLLPVRLGAR